jgi:hypothetical protein
MSDQRVGRSPTWLARPSDPTRRQAPRPMALDESTLSVNYPGRAAPTTASQSMALYATGELGLLAAMV